MSGILARPKSDPVRSYNKKLGRNSGKSAVCDRTNLDSTILASDLLTAAVPILPVFVNTRQAFLADS